MSRGKDTAENCGIVKTFGLDMDIDARMDYLGHGVRAATYELLEKAVQEGFNLINMQLDVRLTLEPMYLSSGRNQYSRRVLNSKRLLDVLKNALTDSGCDGDLCVHLWHMEAKQVIDLIENGE